LEKDKKFEKETNDALGFKNLEGFKKTAVKRPPP